MSSLVKTLRRCHSTVRADRNSWAAISGLDKPDRARRAICVSLVREIVQPARSLPPDLLTGGHQFASGALGKRIHAHAGEHLERPQQLAAGVHAAAPPAQPLAVHQVRAGQLRADAGPAKPLDRLMVAGLGLVISAEQRLRTGAHARPPVGIAGVGHFLQPPHGVGRALGNAGACRGLDKLDQPLGVDGEPLRLEGVGRRGRGERVLEAAEAVAQDRACVVGEGQHRALAARGELPDRRVDHRRGRLLPAAPGGDEHGTVRRCREPDDVGERSHLIDQLLGGGELTEECGCHDAGGQCGRQHREHPASRPISMCRADGTS
jgi:hypothetical protein